MLVVTNRIGELKWLNRKIKGISFREFLKNPVKAKLVYFDGGEDVSPELYGDKTLPQTYNNYKRDLKEAKVYSLAKHLGIPCLGVCRGAQFLTAMQPGGSIIQDVSGHTLYNTHKIKLLNTSKTIEVTSTHHQMMYPFNTNHELLAVSENLSHYYKVGSKEDVKELISKHGEPEVVYYPDTKCLAIQGHPEYIKDINHEFPTYCRETVEEKLFK